MRSRLFYTLAISLLLLSLFATQYTNIVFSASNLPHLSASPNTSVTISGPATAYKDEEVTYTINYEGLNKTARVEYPKNAGFEIVSVNPPVDTSGNTIRWVYQLLGSSSGTITIVGKHTVCDALTLSVTHPHQARIEDIYAPSPVPAEYFASIETEVDCNEPPTVSNVGISPTSKLDEGFVVPSANEDITAIYDYFDLDDDSQGESKIRWTRDDRSQAAFNDQRTIPSDETYAEEKWCVTVTPHDGKEYGERSEQRCAYIEGIPNQLPEAVEVRMNEEYPTNNDELAVSYVYSDTNDHEENTSDVEYRWYRNRTFQPTMSDQQSIPASETNIGEEWCVSVRTHDGIEHGLESEQMCTVINPEGNRLPIADPVWITPTKPIDYDPLVLESSYRDPDGDPEEGSEIQWYRNGNLQSGLDDQHNVSAEFTNAGEEWFVLMRPKDDYDYGGGTEYFGPRAETKPVLVSAELNTAPQAQEAQIIPAGPGDDDRLRLTYKFVDAQQDIESESIIKWYRNGSYMPDYEGKTVIPRDATNVEEEWSAKVTPNDGKDAGDEVEVMAVTIRSVRQNVPPQALDPYLSRGIPGVEEELNLNYEYYDADGDPQGQTQIHWTVDSVAKPEYDQLTLILPSETEVGQEWCATVTAHDGQVSGEDVPVARCVTIELVGRNTKPEASNERITSRPSSTDNLELDYEYFDLDNDPERGTTINWTVNGKLVDTFSGLTVIPGSQTNEGETWQATIRPYDNYDFGESVVLSTTINMAPTLSKVKLPEDPALNQHLTPYYEFHDANGDPIDHLQTRWYKNEQHQAQYDDQATIPASDTSRGEKWYVVIAAHDGYEYGPDVTSKEITIGEDYRNYMPLMLSAPANR